MTKLKLEWNLIFTNFSQSDSNSDARSNGSSTQTDSNSDAHSNDSSTKNESTP